MMVLGMLPINGTFDTLFLCPNNRYKVMSGVDENGNKEVYWLDSHG